MPGYFLTAQYRIGEQLWSRIPIYEHETHYESVISGQRFCKLTGYSLDGNRLALALETITSPFAGIRPQAA
ncbi:MAG: hypothetical protein WC291_00875 [Thermodesulfovibrionales bacterium]|jgi:hypothetical protein